MLLALGIWGERWIELAPQHLDPGIVLQAWVRQFDAGDQVPGGRVVVRFDFPTVPTKGNQLWVIFRPDDSEVCRTHPGFEEDLVVTAEPRALAEWHLGRIAWADASERGQIDVAGPPRLAKALPTWNKRSGFAHLGIEPPGARSKQPSVPQS